MLVVEDDDAVREATTEFLSSIGYRVLSAGNGPEALHSLETHLNEIDLMITDVVMPAMNGTKLAAWHQQSGPNSRYCLCRAMR